jgi:putative addiction module component (TIGR02574 family)
MSPSETLQTVQSWPLPEQLDFAFQVWDGIVDAGWQPELTPELKAELDRRIAAHEADPTRVLTWEQVLAHVRRPR